MKIFVSEFITGGGFLGVPHQEPLSVSLVREGRAMASRLAADFARLAGTQVSLLRDERFELSIPGCEVQAVSSPEAEADAFARFAGASDWTVVIAPEFEGHLLSRCKRVQQVGGRLLGPGLETVTLAADKQRAADLLTRRGVPIPPGVRLSGGDRLPDDFPYPAVLKPIDGAGSQDVQLLTNRRAADRIGRAPFDARLECFAPGLPASVAVLCGAKQRIALLPCRQCLSEDGNFHYLGGALPIEPEMAERARALALAAAAGLDVDRGYMGVDLVLGETCRDDRVIEMNPRLTTSYVGLSAACRQNLAGALLELAEGRSVELAFDEGPLEFTPDGRVRACRIRDSARCEARS